MGKGIVAPAMNPSELRNDAAGSPPAVAAPDSNVTVAVNYSLNDLDRFVSHGTTTTPFSSPGTDSAVEFHVQKIARLNDTEGGAAVGGDGVSACLSQPRRPKRKRTPKKAALEKVLVRYDVKLTPGVRRNRAFLHLWRVGEASTPGTEGTEAASPANNNNNKRLFDETVAPQRASKRLRQKKTPEDVQASSDDVQAGGPCDSCRHFPFCSKAHPDRHPDSHPFSGDESVVWVPASRSEWDDCIDEMTAVCAEAALRRHAVEAAAWEAASRLAPGETRGRGRPRGKPCKPGPPLSRDYIRDRIDIDDPIRGYQIRHRGGGWLQGFVLMTTFTTWTHYFKWDSTHPKSGMRLASGDQETSRKLGWDYGGALSAELEKQPRGGDPLHKGVIWPTIAEISVVGALGCGEFLLRMALDDILRRDCYDYVVLQATDSSRTFYERFGFVRVGAVSKYGSAEAVTGGEQQLQQKAAPVIPVVGYRHWTYADESSHRLSKHGGPSYMMAVRVGRTKADPNGRGHHCAECRRAVGTVSFLDALSDCFVRDKPKVTPNGGTVGRKGKLSGLAGKVDADSPVDVTECKPGANLSTGQHMGQPKPSSTRKMGRDKVEFGGSDCVNPNYSSTRRRTTGDPKTSIDLSRIGKSLSKDASVLTVPPLETPGKRRQARQHGGTVLAPSVAERKTQSYNKKGSGEKKNGAKLIEFTGSQQNKSSKSPRKKCNLRKQRIPAMYRDPNKIYFYNKVVTPRNKSNLRSTTRPYYFVLHYDEDEKVMRIIPLVATGKFDGGKRAGRVRWKATLLDEEPKLVKGCSREDHLQRCLDSMGVITVACSDWDIVPAHATNKGTGIAEESWDIFD